MRQEDPRACVITGATAGIGLEAARQLAARGARIIGLGPSPEHCRVAAEVVRRSVRRAEARFIPADLSTIGGVRRAAALVRRELPSGRLDRLIHGEATVSSRYVGTADGFELQFAVNFLSAFLLTRELFAALIRPAESRVITVSSAAHRRTAIAWDDPMLRRRYNGLRAYRQSKLALVLFTLELNRRASGRFPIRAIGVEPGPAGTRPGLNGSGAGLSAADAAVSIVRLAAEPASAIPGAYWRLGRPAEPSAYARRAGAALRLWSLSEGLCGVDFL